MRLTYILIVFGYLFAAGCSEDPGPQGPAGPAGPAGPPGPPGPPPPAPPPSSEAPDSVNGKSIRSIDGTSNNEQFDDIGSSFERLSRLEGSDYGDFISSLAGASRPSARLISNEVHDQDGASIPNPFGTSDFLWQWGQFLDHDIDLTPGGGDDAPIPVPTGDSDFDPMGTGTQTISLTRSVFDPTTGNIIGNPREQINEITSWIDASNVYGSDTDRLLALREGADSPFLQLSADGLLPLNVNNIPNENGPFGDPTMLFLAGDVRVNEQVGLTVMHTLFVREHNRLAAELQTQFPDNTANEIFFLARRLLGAEMQIITYNEFLPALIGPTALEDYAGYNFLTDSNILNEFSTAAFRFGHSALSPFLQRLDANLNSTPEGPLSLQAAFFNAPSILQTGTDIEPILRGLATQPHQQIDPLIIDDVRNFLFGPPGAGGLDLASLNIQRGRDHGLPSYNDMREALGLPRAATFADISSNATIQTNLASAYATPDDVDLWTGGLSEDPVVASGSQLGELFRRILVLQFSRLRDGDRFWYENDLDSVEMAMVQDITLADIIRMNTGINTEIQDNVFIAP